jgi:hypothetical protein
MSDHRGEAAKKVNIRFRQRLRHAVRLGFQVGMRHAACGMRCVMRCVMCTTSTCCKDDIRPVRVSLRSLRLLMLAEPLPTAPSPWCLGFRMFCAYETSLVFRHSGRPNWSCVLLAVKCWRKVKGEESLYR